MARDRSDFPRSPCLSSDVTSLSDYWVIDFQEAESMIQREASANPFEFVKVAALRAAQLMRGCTARVPKGHKSIITAQLEVAAGMVQALPRVNGPAAASMSGGPLEALPRGNHR